MSTQQLESSPIFFKKLGLHGMTACLIGSSSAEPYDSPGLIMCR